MSDWTPLEDTFLREQWGKTDARDIGAQIGRTKNAVIGRAHRIGLDGIKRVSKKPRVPKTRFARRRMMRAMPEVRRVIPESLFAPPTLAISILDLGKDQCAYIEGDDRLCCGHQTLLEARWCAFHYRVVYRPIDERQRARSPLNQAAE